MSKLKNRICEQCGKEYIKVMDSSLELCPECAQEWQEQVWMEQQQQEEEQRELDRRYDQLWHEEFGEGGN